MVGGRKISPIYVMTEHDFNITQQLKTLKKKDDYDPVLKSMSANYTLFN